MGYKELVNCINLKIPYIQLGIVARRAVLGQQPERMKAFLWGHIAAINIVTEDGDTGKHGLAKDIATRDGSIPAVADHPKAGGCRSERVFR